jgi:hypothetical protein
MLEFNGLMWRWTEALWASVEARKLTKLTLRQGGVGAEWVLWWGFCVG